MTLEEIRSENDAYEYAYGSVMEMVAGQVRQRVELAMKVISCLAYATRQLRISELLDALAIDLGDGQLDSENRPGIMDIISVCCGLVWYCHESQIIRLSHNTTREYLRRVQSQWLRISEDEIGNACIAYLSLKQFEDGICHTDEELEQRIFSYPFYKYAAKNSYA
jgi:hypothetical protein